MEVTLLRAGVPWDVLERAPEERITRYFFVVTEQNKREREGLEQAFAGLR